MRIQNSIDNDRLREVTRRTSLPWSGFGKSHYFLSTNFLLSVILLRSELLSVIAISFYYQLFCYDRDYYQLLLSVFTISYFVTIGTTISYYYQFLLSVILLLDQFYYQLLLSVTISYFWDLPNPGGTSG